MVALKRRSVVAVIFGLLVVSAGVFAPGGALRVAEAQGNPTEEMVAWFGFKDSFRPATALESVTFPEATCNEGRFKPCVCANQVPSEFKYRPELKICGGRAGVILTGSLRRAFSIVMRDRQNRDRFAAPGYNNCTPQEVGMGLARCSYYKVSKSFRTATSSTFCFPFSGRSNQLSRATRFTIKLRDVPNATTDPLLRICMQGFSAKNPVN